MALLWGTGRPGLYDRRQAACTRRAARGAGLPIFARQCHQRSYQLSDFLPPRSAKLPAAARWVAPNDILARAAKVIFEKSSVAPYAGLDAKLTTTRRAVHGFFLHRSLPPAIRAGRPGPRPAALPQNGSLKKDTMAGGSLHWVRGPHPRRHSLQSWTVDASLRFRGAEWQYAFSSCRVRSNPYNLASACAARSRDPTAFSAEEDASFSGRVLRSWTGGRKAARLSSASRARAPVWVKDRLRDRDDGRGQPFARSL